MIAKYQYEETLLLKQLAEGDEKALSEIYLHYWQSLFTAAHNILKDKAACEDILQDIFLQLWVKRTTLAIHDSLQAYLHAATRYQVFRYIKTGSAKSFVFDTLPSLTEPSPEGIFREKEMNIIVDDVVNRLPEKCRTIYKLSREQQLSHREIAEYLHISPKTVENQITIALRKLRVSLGKMVSLFLF